MNKIQFFVFILLMQCNLYAQDHSVKFSLRTSLNSNAFPALVSNKQWDGAKVIDLISTSNMGHTLESGSKIGWTLFLQPNGAWGWNIGDGKNRLDYLPTDKQKINDGKWHKLAISFFKDKKTAWLYFDGINVAIYSLSELDLNKLDFTHLTESTKTKGIEIKDIEEGNFKMDPKIAATEFDPKTAESKLYRSDKPDKLTIMGWNIWHGGRHNGIEKGIEQTIEAIRQSGADLVCMQETYGSGPAISDALGTVFYYRSSNLSVHSKFPILDTYDLYQPFRLGGVRVKMGSQLMDVFSLWIHYLPSVSKMYPGENVDKILEEENKTRGSEIKDVLKSLNSAGLSGENVPLVVAGDYNSSSHLDWGEDMKIFHHGYQIEWPVSKSMADAGFKDSFREMMPNPKNSLGYTWSPRFNKGLQSRIDYVYYKGRINCVNSYVQGYTDSEWPSDHAAVVSQFRFTQETGENE